MPLRLIIVVVLRMECLLLPFYGLHLFLQSLLQDDRYTGARSSPSIAIPFFACVLAVAFWQLAPWLARFILGERDGSVTLAGLCLEDLYRFAFVFLGLYFALSSLGPMLTWAHYTFSVAATSAGPTVAQRRALYGLLHPAVTLAAGLVCIFKGPRWATKLADRDKRTEPGTAPNGGPATPVGNSGAAEGPPSVS